MTSQYSPQEEFLTTAQMSIHVCFFVDLAPSFKPDVEEHSIGDFFVRQPGALISGARPDLESDTIQV